MGLLRWHRLERGPRTLDFTSSRIPLRTPGHFYPLAHSDWAPQSREAGTRASLGPSQGYRSAAPPSPFTLPSYALGAPDQDRLRNRCNKD